jgi:hypothetical protein
MAVSADTPVLGPQSLMVARIAELETQTEE